MSGGQHHPETQRVDELPLLVFRVHVLRHAIDLTDHR
jgi:hypothetical protein